MTSDNNANDDEEDDDYAVLQIAREKELIAYITEPLSILPEGITNVVTSELSIVLRKHVC